jgi:hypothetical protein
MVVVVLFSVIAYDSRERASRQALYRENVVMEAEEF